MVDALEAIAQDGGLAIARVMFETPPTSLQGAPRADRLTDLVLPDDADIARAVEQLLQQIKRIQARIFRKLAGQRVKLAKLAPHQLGTEDAVLSRAEPERTLDVLTVIGQPLERGMRRCRRLGKVVANPSAGAGKVLEVLARVGWGAGLASGLEVLLGTAGDARVLQQLAEEGATAALARADQI